MLTIYFSLLLAPVAVLLTGIGIAIGVARYMTAIKAAKPPVQSDTMK